jgi:hypothetical protein
MHDVMAVEADTAIDIMFTTEMACGAQDEIA